MTLPSIVIRNHSEESFGRLMMAVVAVNANKAVQHIDLKALNTLKYFLRAAELRNPKNLRIFRMTQLTVCKCEKGTAFLREEAKRKPQRAFCLVFGVNLSR